MYRYLRQAVKWEEMLLYCTLHGRSKRSGRSGFGRTSFRESVHVFGIAHAQKYTYLNVYVTRIVCDSYIESTTVTDKISENWGGNSKESEKKVPMLHFDARSECV